jgi:hypothetical protein
MRVLLAGNARRGGESVAMRAQLTDFRNDEHLKTPSAGLQRDPMRREMKLLDERDGANAHFGERNKHLSLQLV